MLVGPASPRDLSSLLSGRDRELAETIDGYRGIPVSELAKALVDAGLHVEVATTAPEIDSPLALEGPRLRLHLVPMRPRARDRALSAFSRERAGLCAAIDGADAGVVHAHWTYEFAWAGLDSGRPVVVTAHDAPLTIARHYRDAYRALRTAMAYVVRLRTRRLTAVSPYLADRWRREMRYRRPIAVVPNVAPALPGCLPAGKGQVYIADVADSGRHKNVAGLVRAFRLLRKREHELGLDLVGPGLGAGEALHRALEGEGPCHGIAFHGRLGREQLSSVLSGASVFVHPSYEECCSTAVLEAMQAGVPVVAGRGAGGTPWMLDHGRAGVLVDVGDPGAIADAVAAVLADPELAQTLSERARTRIGEVFSPAAVASAYIDLYEQALTEAV